MTLRRTIAAPTLRILGTIAIAVPLAGCAATGGAGGADADPAAMSDAEATFSTRMAAVRATGRELAASPGDPAIRESLKKVIWLRSNPQDLRIEALEALIADEPGLDDTRRMLALMLPTESAYREWGMIERIGEVAADNGWTDLTPGFVASFAREAVQPPDDQRPELAAIRALHPGQDPAEVVFDVFVGRYETPRDLRDRDRLAAWSLMSRLDPTGEVAARLLPGVDARTRRDDPLVATLVQVHDALGIVPATGEELAWAERLLEPEHDVFVGAAYRVVVGLSPVQAEGLRLRHLAPLVWAASNEPAWLDASRSEHLSAIDAALDRSKHYQRTGGSARHEAETLRANRDRLVWADLIAVRLALVALGDETLGAELFAIADQDHNDTSTEHGGVIAATADGFAAWHYPPRPAQRMGDRRFIASDDLLRNATAEPFHFHFHASSHGNREYAGPSAGDLLYVDLFRCQAIVLTFINRNELNADYYQPGGARLDLGTINRPD